MPKQLTDKQLDLYDSLREKILSARRKLKRRRREIEDTQGGRMQALPALLIPKRPPSRQYIMRRVDPWKDYHKWLANMKLSLRTLREHRRNYFIAFRNILQHFGINFKNGRITQAEIQQHMYDDSLVDIMKSYNEMFNLSYGKNGLLTFTDMYERGYIEQLHWIYDELDGKVYAGTFSAEQKDLIRSFKELRNRNSVSDTLANNTYNRNKMKKKGGK